MAPGLRVHDDDAHASEGRAGAPGGVFRRRRVGKLAQEGLERAREVVDVAGAGRRGNADDEPGRLPRRRPRGGDGPGACGVRGATRRRSSARREGRGTRGGGSGAGRSRTIRAAFSSASAESLSASRATRRVSSTSSESTRVSAGAVGARGWPARRARRRAPTSRTAGAGAARDDAIAQHVAATTSSANDARRALARRGGGAPAPPGFRDAPEAPPPPPRPARRGSTRGRPSRPTPRPRATSSSVRGILPERTRRRNGPPPLRRARPRVVRLPRSPRPRPRRDARARARECEMPRGGAAGPRRSYGTARRRRARCTAVYALSNKSRPAAVACDASDVARRV